MPQSPTDKPFLAAIAGAAREYPPIWLMRQAGRYLPEYRAVREQAGSFLDLCLTPELAIEVTLQPLRRFALDAAIIFSDILVVPQALGQAVSFDEGRGPLLSALREVGEIDRLRFRPENLTPVYRALEGVKRELPAGVALIGFAGAPWTLASYMIEGGSSKDFAKAKAWAYGDPASFARLIDLLTASIADHLILQIAAGAEAVQIFDSWAGVLAEPALIQWSVAPIAEIYRRVKAAYPEIPVIVFPRQAGLLYAAYTNAADALGLDTTVPVGWAAANLVGRVAVQGNLDPVVLATGGPPLRLEARRILTALGSGRYVFNLGHGVLPQTPPEHVAELVELVHDWRLGRS